MGSSAAFYVKGIHAKLGFYAAWPPMQSYAVGDVGLLNDGQFEKVTTLKQLGLSFDVEVGAQGEDFSYTSGKNVSLQLKAQGETLPGASIPQGKAGAVVKFNAEGAFVFQARSPSIRAIGDQLSLSQEILKRFRSKDGKSKWKEEWCVITDLMTAEKVTVLVSNSSSSEVELTVEGKLPASATPLASAGAGLRIASQKGEVVSVLAAAHLTPLFRLSRIRRTFLDRLLDRDGSADLRRASAASRTSIANMAFEPVPVKDAFQRPTRAWAPAVKPKSITKKGGKPKPSARGKKGVKRGKTG